LSSKGLPIPIHLLVSIDIHNCSLASSTDFTIYEFDDGKRNFEDLYVVHEKLGEGAHSVTHKCFLRSNSKQPYSVKTFRVDQDEEEKINSAQNEFCLVMKLDSPYVIQAIDCFQEKFSTKIVFENFKAMSLMEYVQKNYPLKSKLQRLTL
jgi:serine/threonine protein kinase